MKRGIKQKSKSPQKPRPPPPPLKPAYKVNWKEKSLEDITPHFKMSASVSGLSPTKSDFLSSMGAYSLNILSKMSKESE